MWDYGYGGPMMGYGGYGDYGVLHLLFSVFWVIVLIVVIVAVIRRVRGGKRGHWHRYCGNSALDVLRERYAKGEIEKAEYEERKKVLCD